MQFLHIKYLFHKTSTVTIYYLTTLILYYRKKPNMLSSGIEFRRFAHDKHPGGPRPRYWSCAMPLHVCAGPALGRTSSPKP